MLRGGLGRFYSYYGVLSLLHRYAFGSDDGGAAEAVMVGLHHLNTQIIVATQ